MNKTLLIISCLLLFTSCSLKKGYIQFNEENKDEIISSQAIKEHLKKHPNPSIVLKAPDVGNHVTESNDNSYIYNAIEKELLLGGFDVKDRGLFNEVVNKSKEIDYAEIKRITGTDLILELVQIDVERGYKTNTFFGANGNQIVEPGIVFEKGGVIVEFKITIIENNVYGGSYLFHYTPCKEKTTSCDCEVIYKSMPQTVYLNRSFCNDPNVDKKGYKIFPRDKATSFVRDVVRKMISAIKE
ncbi:hypothetical protein [Lacinutrix sp. 5H-3-7-4]|uniref:hypothetical protein n=1 Tax=Lacinutrix sp. (strain 5H-3-7-4) TaxID=983544 RepID=UPI00020A3CFB|nr:hypothetical protein [Lacinutrix sp. 5H-3-7-4]AEH01948.1 hypothetical protein Lacal_2102 [Lacinutrix sp. 5H-3-7-4]